MERWEPEPTWRRVLRPTLIVGSVGAWIGLGIAGHPVTGFWLFLFGTACLWAMRPSRVRHAKQAPTAIFDRQLRNQAAGVLVVAVAMLGAGIYAIAHDHAYGVAPLIIIGALAGIHVGMHGFAFLQAGGGGYEAARKFRLWRRSERPEASSDHDPD
jgi:hypothetical protein